MVGHPDAIPAGGLGVFGSGEQFLPGLAGAGPVRESHPLNLLSQLESRDAEEFRSSHRELCDWMPPHCSIPVLASHSNSPAATRQIAGKHTDRWLRPTSPDQLRNTS